VLPGLGPVRCSTSRACARRDRRTVVGSVEDVERAAGGATRPPPPRQLLGSLTRCASRLRVVALLDDHGCSQPTAQGSAAVAHHRHGLKNSTPRRGHLPARRRSHCTEQHSRVSRLVRGLCRRRTARRHSGKKCISILIMRALEGLAAAALDVNEKARACRRASALRNCAKQWRIGEKRRV